MFSQQSSLLNFARKSEDVMPFPYYEVNCSFEPSVGISLTIDHQTNDCFRAITFKKSPWMISRPSRYDASRSLPRLTPSTTAASDLDSMKRKRIENAGDSKRSNKSTKEPWRYHRKTQEEAERCLRAREEEEKDRWRHNARTSGRS